ncbi:MAG: hypothetical protein M1816_001649 [Peltula sp. TS41687]|nr:MAG: hypothetical protein M1816_001649 [Peltula sp. TS41687]
MGLAWYKGRQVRGEQDVIALWAILSSSCVLAVPLLNWQGLSSNAFVTTEANRQQVRNDPERTSSTTNHHILDWTATTIPDFTWSMCQPNRPVNASELVDPDGPDVYLPVPVDQEFLSRYNCTQPCQKPYVGHRTQFRERNSLQLLTMEQAYGKTHDEDFDTFVGGIAATTTLSFPIAVFLGLYTLIFPDGRPREVRNTVFRFFAGISRSSKTNANLKVPVWRKYAAQFVAIISYIFTILTLIFCIPMFILNIIALELALKDYSESERPWYVGQWSPMVGAVLAVLAAIVDKYWTTFVDFLKEKILRRPPSKRPGKTRKENTREADILHRRISSRRQAVNAGLGSSRRDPQLRYEERRFKGLTKLLHDLGKEWRHFVAFYRDPIEECCGLPNSLPTTSSKDSKYTHLEDGATELSGSVIHGASDQVLPSHQPSRRSERGPKTGPDISSTEEADSQLREWDRRTSDIESAAQNSIYEQDLSLLHAKHA